QIAGDLRLELAQYRELESFAQFGADLDESTKAQLTRGERLVELLKQGQFEPMAVVDQILEIFVGVNGHLDDLDTEKVRDFVKEVVDYIKTKNSKLIEKIEKKEELDEETEEKLNKIIKNFKEVYASKYIDKEKEKENKEQEEKTESADEDKKGNSKKEVDEKENQKSKE
ncbi:MAG TPA: hypothetical protein VKN74_04280, partial [Candidatus Mcinerneyibacterium sp.]|nr:hypothetical protein [Candidatus Mcinerneyibacterium sp.]